MKLQMTAIVFGSLVLLSTASISQAYDVLCTGYDSAGSFVQGHCDDGMFRGYDTTGAMIEGSCAAGQMFTAYNGQTGAMVTGNCEPAQSL
jgi:hypothetical protein